MLVEMGLHPLGAHDIVAQHRLDVDGRRWVSVCPREGEMG